MYSYLLCKYHHPRNFYRFVPVRYLYNNRKRLKYRYYDTDAVSHKAFAIAYYTDLREHKSDRFSVRLDRVRQSEHKKNNRSTTAVT